MEHLEVAGLPGNLGLWFMFRPLSVIFAALASLPSISGFPFWTDDFLNSFFFFFSVKVFKTPTSGKCTPPSQIKLHQILNSCVH